MKTKISKNIGIFSVRTALFLFLAIFILFSNCPAEDELMRISEAGNKSQSSENNIETLTNIPYANSANESVPLVSDKNIQKSDIKAAVSGLKDAGYSIDEISEILKNDNKSAAEISHGCLSSGYNGKDIHRALIKAGFKTQEAEAAVPPALRTDGQVFSANKNNPDSVAAEKSLISPNPFSAQVLKSQDQPEIKNQTKEAIPLNVEVNVGITFNGLADWNRFQNKRFDNK